ncbi:internalin [Acinetobacter defluvii]|uniref:Internalin n=1 Tax=Acinetobacter defluvii TaxID=1871111 RepID=A0A2S2FF30_9GAMM|nr:hypothetical protein [Acinetobacter defluvii]AWL28932.1 internalin [Acinetobacter defluvii]
MNKKLLICGLIATGLVLTACVKKEEPKNDEPEKVETTQTQQPEPQPAQFENLETVDQEHDQQINQGGSSEQVNAGQTETTTPRNNVQPAPAPRVEQPKAVQTTEVTRTEQPKPAAPKPAPVETARTETPAPKANSATAQTEDDAVAAAIAAATPALKN